MVTAANDRLEPLGRVGKRDSARATRHPEARSGLTHPQRRLKLGADYGAKPQPQLALINRDCLMSDLSEEAGETLWNGWFSGKEFTTDWSSRAFPTWISVLSHLKDKPLNILEVGAWEGRGSIFLLNFFPHSTITCMDIFTLGNEGLFDRNLAEYGDRVIKVRGRSVQELDKMNFPDSTSTSNRKSFDLIYVDGSHDRDDVIMDSVLAWRVLNVGGILIWDDYEIFTVMAGHFTKDQDPKPAIDSFMSWHGGELETLHKGYQMIVRKTKEHYCSPHG